jgi:hypothetical protein
MNQATLAAISTVPADPGRFFLLDWHEHEDGSPRVIEVPVIAWVVSQCGANTEPEDFFATPVTPVFVLEVINGADGYYVLDKSTDWVYPLNGDLPMSRNEWEFLIGKRLGNGRAFAGHANG